MGTGTRRRLGLVILGVAWSIVVAGGALAVVSLLGHGVDSDEHAGIGFALVMGGMLIVLMGNYIVHRANISVGEGDD